MLGRLGGRSQGCLLHARVRAKWSDLENGGFFHAPLSLEVGGGVLVSFPAQSRGKKKKIKSSFKKNRLGKTKSL